MLLIALLLTLAQPDRTPVLLDTDIGTDIDDAFALGWLLASPEIDLRGVTAVGADASKRALFLSRFLTMTGRRAIAIAAGADPQPPRDFGPQYQYYYHPDVLFNRTFRPVKEPAVEFLYSRLKGRPGTTLLAIGPLTNVGRLLTEKPDCKPWIKRIVMTGGAGNFAADLKAARAVFASGVPLVVVPPEAADGLKLSEVQLKKVFAPGTPLSMQIQVLHQLWDKGPAPLADALTAAQCLGDRYCTFEERAVELDDKGVPRAGKGKANARVATAVKAMEFLAAYVDLLASCVPPAQTPLEPIARGGMPHRVHVAEDFDTDIERRWWMAGKPERKDLPPGSTRAVRGVLTHDFDDLLGNPKAMHTAVVFNPVPGPPMGKNARLTFRYHLTGTDTLRVQIYSLTNGYHRHLVLHRLRQGKWMEATVDMTKARRPDGTGGPLSEGERIDDIQFYADPKAELLIDDIVLYDAATAGEKRAFPKRIHFTGWFDSGKQGKEWPGDFLIVPGKGYFWHAAASVPSKALDVPWVRVDLRGARPVGKATSVRFRYRLTGTDRVTVTLVSRDRKESLAQTVIELTTEVWGEATAEFKTPGKDYRIDEVRFTVPSGADLLVDDVLLHEP
jgi:purine nucleosidase